MDELNMDTPWDVVEIGRNGQIELIPRDKDQHQVLPQSTLPFGLPPVLPDLKIQLEEFICSPEKLPIHNFERVHKYWPRKPDPDRLFSMDVSPLSTELRVERDPTTGKLIGFAEVEIANPVGTANSSLSMCRLPGKPADAVYGSTTNYPFLPGGMDEPIVNNSKGLDNIDNINFETDLLIIPPGFSEGMTFAKEPTDEDVVPIPTEKQEKNILNLASILTVGDDFSYISSVKQQEKEKGIDLKSKEDVPLIPVIETPEIAELEEKLISKEIPVLNISKVTTNTTKSTKWAKVVPVTQRVPDFDKKIPNMAYTWPFELDPFQQHAILHLENNDSVFVAAHTSAGKTVVAEYAIALSQNHKTRTIYTSPIKALSNQKFRDFKQTFTDVGLLTGDIQINGEASCLIMTTEILRSMLYRGADTLRDVEWVIFDEVHYINDKERGVVWEEVLIMLPAQVNIVMLSATVPNVVEFADWVGSIKKREIFVISTVKRPIPLEHYLYTGSGGKTKDECFLVVDKDSKFSEQGFKTVLEAMSRHHSKMFGKGGPPVKGGHRIQLNPKQEETMWSGLISYLKQKDWLPVIAFTFSRKRCDENAARLSSLDLTTAAEKHEIRIFFSKCVQRLKECDRQLPQVKLMSTLLTNGIGLHHSGILPILKEVVEMLFQRECVKLLFATETFAIGVNMPARTVIFDSIRKHDGETFRNLLPSEYIQMAGRAGRRGKDNKGFVIVLCKTTVPDQLDLNQMMLGKPTKLESKFRLTYSMILNLLRVKHLRVEEMIKRSFYEVDMPQQHKIYEKRLATLVGVSETLVDVSCHVCAPDLKHFTIKAMQVVELKEDFHSHLMKQYGQKNYAKTVIPGRVIVIDYGIQGHTLSVVLKVRQKVLEVLLLTAPKELENGESEKPSISNEKKEENKFEVTDLWRKVKSLIPQKLFVPEGHCSHAVQQLEPLNIVSVTKENIKVDYEKILNDWNKRQQARFRFDPPSEACNSVTQQLLRLSEDNPDMYATDDICSVFSLKKLETVTKVKEFTDNRKLLSQYQCLNCSNFDEHLKQELLNMKIRADIKECKFQLSDAALKSTPDYQARVAVLKESGYVDKNTGVVSLKGKVACKISNHELMVTELVLNNMLVEMQPAEIAAALSCFVFQQKSYSPVTLLPNLEESKNKILEMAKDIDKLQKEFGVDEPMRDFVDQFNFDLANVVYEWANNVPFSKIAQMTEVQEGIIVRCIQRLDEILRDIKGVADIIGSPVLPQKMEEVSKLIRRDIVFAASLYTQE